MTFNLWDYNAEASMSGMLSRVLVCVFASIIIRLLKSAGV